MSEKTFIRNYILSFPGLNTRFFEEASADWDEVLNNAAFSSVAYTRSMVQYQAQYMEGSSAVFFNLSLVIYHGGNPVAIWPFCLRLNENVWQCGSNDGPVLPPLFRIGMSEKSMKAIIRGCLDLLMGICRETNQTCWQGEEIAGGYGVSLWHRFVMDYGAKAVVYHELYTDLSLELAQIRAIIRKSYKPLISLGRKLWRSQILTNVDCTVFNEFRLFHQKVAGRITRPKATWDLLQQSINNGDAFLVTLRDDSDALVGGGLFLTSPHEGVYAVGVYDRSLFEKPLGHVVQMLAIEHMKELGLRWYRIGSRPYEGDCDTATEKEMHIAKFKEGFSSHLFLKIRTLSQVPTDAVI